MSDSTIIKPLISNTESKLISLEMELKATDRNIALGYYDDRLELKNMVKYKKHIQDRIMELTILGGD